MADFCALTIVEQTAHCQISGPKGLPAGTTTPAGSPLTGLGCSFKRNYHELRKTVSANCTTFEIMNRLHLEKSSSVETLQLLSMGVVG